MNVKKILFLPVVLLSLNSFADSFVAIVQSENIEIIEEIENKNPVGMANRIFGGVENGFLITKSNSLNAVGYNAGNQTGISDPNDITTWTYSNLNNIKQVVAQRCFSYALTLDGDLYVIGENNYGQLGLGDNVSRSNWVKTNVAGKKVKQIAAGSSGSSSHCSDSPKGHAYALTIDGLVYSTGHNSDGQLGLGTWSDTNEWLYTGMFDIKQISAGSYFGLALKNSGDVFGVGWNSNCQIGVVDNISSSGEPNCSSKNTWINTGLDNIIGVSGGRDHSVAISDTNDLYVTGKNDKGQLGLGGSIVESSWALSFSGVKKIAVHSEGFHNYLIDTNNELYVVGLNSNYQLGLGDLNQKNNWIKTGIKDVKEITSGAWHGYYINDKNEVLSVGQNVDGQLSVGDKLYRSNWTLTK